MSINRGIKKDSKLSTIGVIALIAVFGTLKDTVVIDSTGIEFKMRNAQAANSSQSGQHQYHTYVIHTYGGADLIPIVQQQLESVAGGGSVSAYQDKLVIRTTAKGYSEVQRLLAQVDTAPQPIQISVKVGGYNSRAESKQQGQIIITSSGKRVRKENLTLGAYGRYNRNINQSHNNSIYRVNTLSGSPAHIGTSTLVSLLKRQTGTLRNRYGQPVGYITINGITLASTVQSIAVIPKLLPSNQVQVSINQVEDRATGKALIPINVIPIKTQQLATTLTVPRGQWVTIGEVRQNESDSRIGSDGSQSMHSNDYYPIQIKID